VSDRQSQKRAVTIAVVSWNTRALLAGCVESLRDREDEGLAEVWVVDNASSDGSAELVRERFPWVKLIASAENLGFAPRSHGSARATGEHN
jgi:GT2 family glycosyltransferase